MRMSEQRELVEAQHKDGPPWDTVRVFSSFDEADRFRKSVLTSSKQVKVKKTTQYDRSRNICREEQE